MKLISSLAFFQLASSEIICKAAARNSVDCKAKCRLTRMCLSEMSDEVRECEKFGINFTLMSVQKTRKGFVYEVFNDQDNDIAKILVDWATTIKSRSQWGVQSLYSTMCTELYQPFIPPVENIAGLEDVSEDDLEAEV